MFLLSIQVTLLVLLLSAPSSIRADSALDAPIDWNRARQLYQREQRGERLTPDEQAYLDRAKAERAKGNGLAGAKPPGPPTESTGLVPLTQLKGDQKYKGVDGGLYGKGSNEPPESQRRAAMDAAARVVPLDPDGKPSPSGKIVLMSIGMSNTTMEFSVFKRLADADPDKSADVTIVDAAQGGKDAAAWAKVPPEDNPVWQEADRRLILAGVTPKQVEVVWIKQALMAPSRLGEFPAHMKVLQDDLVTILDFAKAHYPNLRLAYLSSRIYAGYATTPLNPEPYACESAFSVRGVIEDQIAGAAKLNADPSKGPVKAPVVLWGPYLWADGVKGREGDDLVYKREDLAADGTHPSRSGRQKIAAMLLKFFKSDPSCKPWFVKERG